MRFSEGRVPFSVLEQTIARLKRRRKARSRRDFGRPD
jgi:hypothetical protein